MPIARLRICGERTALVSGSEQSEPPIQGRDRRTWYYDSCTSAIADCLSASISESSGTCPEVILPAYSSPAVANAVKLAGAKPRFVDFLKNSTAIDPMEVRKSLNPATAAVLLVRLLGLPSNSDDVRQMAGAQSIPIIEDAAHSYWEDCLTPMHCDAVAFSFSWGKPVSAGGGGALVLANSVRIDPSRLNSLAAIKPSLVTKFLTSSQTLARNLATAPVAHGIACRLLGIRSENLIYPSSVGIRGIRSDHLRRIRGIAEHRREGQLRLQAAYSAAISDLPSDRILDLSPSPSSIRSPLWWRYPVLLETERLRDECFVALQKYGLGPSKLYQNLLVHREEPEIQKRLWPNACNLAARLLTLPTHSDVTEDHVYRMIQIIRRILAFNHRK